MKQIYEKLPSSEAVLGKLDEYGQRCTVDIPITGPNGNTVNVRTGWIIKNGSDVPELTTIYVKDQLGDIMKFKECDAVRIMVDCGETVKKGEIGAVLMVFEEPQEAYEVEFLDDEGNTKAQYTLRPDDLELVKFQDKRRASYNVWGCRTK